MVTTVLCRGRHLLLTVGECVRDEKTSAPPLPPKTNYKSLSILGKIKRTRFILPPFRLFYFTSERVNRDLPAAAANTKLHEEV